MKDELHQVQLRVLNSLKSDVFKLQWMSFEVYLDVFDAEKGLYWWHDSFSIVVDSLDRNRFVISLMCLASDNE